MAVSAIEKNKTHNSGNISYLKSMTFGALTGYVLKYALPITPQERDENFKTALNEIKLRAQQAKIDEIMLIKEEKNELEGADFFNRKKNQKFKLSEIKNNEKVMKLIRRVNEKAREVNILGRKKENAYVKNIRPNGTFIFAGAGIALLAAITNNIINKIAEERVNAKL